MTDTTYNFQYENIFAMVFIEHINCRSRLQYWDIYTYKYSFEDKVRFQFSYVKKMHVFILFSSVFLDADFEIRFFYGRRTHLVFEL